MNMTLKEMILELNDKINCIEEHLDEQRIALKSLKESCYLIATGLKKFIDDFYGTSETEQPPPVKLPVAVKGNLLEKIKDPIFLKELGEKIKKETESMNKLEEELEKIQDQITKGVIGES